MSQRRRMLISADLEGVAGVVNSEELRPGNPEYERARGLMTDEVNAAIRGIRTADEDAEIVVVDAHGTFRNLLPDRLDHSALLLRGKPRTLAMVHGVDEADGLVLIGYHAKAGRSGVLTHTFDDNVRDIRCNGISLGEAGLAAAVATHYDVPLLVATGDDALVEEVQMLTDRSATVSVKRAASSFAAQSLHPQVACARIEEAVAVAVTTWQGGSVSIPGPVHVELDLATTGQADRAAMPPPVRRTAPLTVEVQADDIVGAYRWLRALTALAASS